MEEEKRKRKREDIIAESRDYNHAGLRLPTLPGQVVIRRMDKPLASWLVILFLSIDETLISDPSIHEENQSRDI